MTDTVHMLKGALAQDATTACRLRLEDLPRSCSTVPYSRRSQVTCNACQKAADRIATLRGEAA